MFLVKTAREEIKKEGFSKKRNNFLMVLAYSFQFIANIL